MLEIYVRDNEAQSKTALALVHTLSRTHEGLVIARRDISASAENQKRLSQIAKHYGVSDKTTPLVYACNRVISGYGGQDDFTRQLRRMLRMEVFVRHGCQRCASAQAYLRDFPRRYGGLEITYREITGDAKALADMNRLIAQHKTRAASVPVIHLCDRLIIGYSKASLTQNRLAATLKHWTMPCAKKQKKPPAPPASSGAASSMQAPHQRYLLGSVTIPRHTFSARLPHVMTQALLAFDQSESSKENDLDDEFALPLPSAPSDEELDDGLPLPALTDDETSEDADSSPSVELPILGKLNVRRVGLPALTIAVGLVDGFNPCAMWVLLFLLSLLVNLKDRWRILAIAGAFILVSGLAYFAFMAAWLNVFLFVGYLRPIQISLGLIAIAVGSIHIKDFFAFHQGFSLSIPESAKPGIYAQTRRIITAENISGALIGATILAVMVNIVELLCTAGLPALYTEILTMQNLPAWQNYAYLALYNACYMLDDTLMVGLVVITLSKRKLQENQGRWLKLLSGAVIAILGVIMIVQPDLLV